MFTLIYNVDIHHLGFSKSVYPIRLETFCATNNIYYYKSLLLLLQAYILR